MIPVSRLTRAIAERLAAFGPVAVEGEVGGLRRPGSGHVYFGLKEGGAVLSCAIWRSRLERALTFDLEEGARVVCHGRLDVYAPRGTYSLMVERVERRGVGELLARLEALKSELRGRGWFDRRRRLPVLPTTVGVVTSRDADGWRDFLRTRTLRWPLYPLRLAHTRVQGAGAADGIAQAVARLDASGVDVICLVRGGGSLEDLWCFNERAVAEAVWGASVPVVTGVGHESDVTLADLVADHRAHTPTDAAQTVIPDREALSRDLERRGAYLVEAVDRRLAAREERLVALARRLPLAGPRPMERHAARMERLGAALERQSPGARLAALELALATLGPRLVQGVGAATLPRQRRLELAGRTLEAVSPFAVLGRGYSITRRAAGGPPLLRAGELAAGERVETRLAEGALLSEVLEVRGEEG